MVEWVWEDEETVLNKNDEFQRRISTWKLKLLKSLKPGGYDKAMKMSWFTQWGTEQGSRTLQCTARGTTNQLIWFPNMQAKIGRADWLGRLNWLGWIISPGPDATIKMNVLVKSAQSVLSFINSKLKFIKRL